MRSKFDEQLYDLQRELINMGQMCEKAILISSDALVNGDKNLAKMVPEMSDEIDRKERKIEEMCLRLLLQQQPVATDLRVISAALKMVTDMERIGDNSGDIAEIISVSDIGREDRTETIAKMAEATSNMVVKSIDAFTNKDIELAKKVIDYDDLVDGYFAEVREELIACIRRGKADAKKIIDLLMIAKYFERIGDHAVNIAGWVIFSITGEKD